MTTQMSVRDRLRSVLDQEARGPLPRPVWALVVEAIEVTAMAACCERDGDDGSAALLASCATSATEHARALLSEPAGAPPRTLTEPTSRGSLQRVRFTTARLLDLTAAPETTAEAACDAALAAHAAALEDWRRQLIARVRVAQAAGQPARSLAS